MRIGILVATKPEWEPFIEIFGDPIAYFKATDNGCGFERAKWSTGRHFITLIMSGYGEIAAASATQYLIDKCNIDIIINYGVVGGLHEMHEVKKIGIVRKIVHYDFDLSIGGNKYPVGRYPNQKDLFISPKRDALPADFMERFDELTCASADKFVCGGEPKRKLREKFGADVCEMEAAGIVITCNRNNVPCSFIKAVSDGVDEDEEAFDMNVHEASKVCVELISEALKVLY